MSKVLFQEKQKFTQWWLWLLLIALGLLPIYGIYKQLIKGESFGDKPFSDVGLVLFAIFVFGFILFFWLMQLHTTIDNEKIKVRFFPFFTKTFSWKEIKSAKIVKYGFVGYGIRLSLNNGTVYNVKGNKGLYIQLKDGKKRLIGTQRPEELQKVVVGLKS